DSLEQDDRVALRRAVAQAQDREAPDGRVVVGVGERVQERPSRVDLARGIPREELQREQRRAAAGRALVLQPPPQELCLLAKAELPDRAIGHDPLPVVGRARRQLELLVPVAPEVGELPLLALLRQLVREGGCLGERHTEASDRSAGPTYSADGRKSLPVRFCSRMCADQPATREHANIAGASAGGISAMSSTTAE